MSAQADVLIVGAGSAGCILAERLSADPSRRVLVLEAGPDRNSPQIAALTDDAAVLPIGPASPVARRYRAELAAGHWAQIARGSVLGGSGAVNGGYFCPAPPDDFDAWPPGWSWAEVEPHYQAVEQRIPTQPQREFGTPTVAFVTAAEAAGFRWLPGLAGGRATGAQPPGLAAVPLNIVDGRRRGPGAAFLEPSRGRGNLVVRTGVRVTRLMSGGGRVTGAHTTGPDGPARLRADHVVLCAGAVETARLLLLSGIGPAAALGALGIPVLADLPVGQAFRDHPEWVLSTGWPPAAGHPALEAVLLAEGLEIRPYTMGFGSGADPMGFGSGAGPGGFGSGAGPGGFGSGAVGVGVALLRPRASGRLSLVSADPAAPPRIEHRYDSEPADLAALRRGCELVGEILKGATELGLPAWSTSQHLCGTAPMGAGGRAVVDTQCRVLGLAGLSVVDGSVLPEIPSRGPHATIAMVAHRAAEFF